MGDGLLTWRRVQPAIAELTRACSYDRAGYGWSEVRAQPRDPERIAEELRALLNRADEPAPFVLAGHSIGGVFVRVFARRYPDDVAGLLFVDSTVVGPIAAVPAPLRAVLGSIPMLELSLCRAAAPIGLLRLTDTSDPALRAKDCTTAFQELAAFDPSEVPTGPLPADIPTVILAAAGSDVKEQREELSRLSSNSRTIVVEGSGHHIQLDRPDAVIDAVRELIAPG